MKQINSSYTLTEFLSGRKSGTDTVVNVGTDTNEVLCDLQAINL